MGNLEIARLCQSPASLPHCFMCSCAGQRPHFELLIRGNGKSICKCWIYFFSIASMLSAVFLSGKLMYLTPPLVSSLQLLCLHVCCPFFSYPTEPNALQSKHSNSDQIASTTTNSYPSKSTAQSAPQFLLILIQWCFLYHANRCKSLKIGLQLL